jgi:hypothetical protein
MLACLLVLLVSLSALAQEGPCAEPCLDAGLCARVDGVCHAQSDQHCHWSGGCAVEGRCTHRDGACVVGGPEDCAGSQACQYGGQCAFVDGACTHSQQACADSEPCRDHGQCHQQGDACVAQSDADCQASEFCGSYGACFEHEGRCSATSTSCASSQACLERGRCERDGELCATPSELAESQAREAELMAQAQSLLGLVTAPPESSFDFSTELGDAFYGGIGGVVMDDDVGMFDARPAPTRPHRNLDPDDITCPMDTQRQTEKVPEQHTLTWCALPDGRKKGPELLVYAGGGQRMYTEYLLDQEHGEHVITEADGRVMVLGRFELGREEGSWQSWYIGGDRASRGEYHAGKKIGIWTEWSRDGEESRCDYRDPAVPDLQCVAPKD